MKCDSGKSSEGCRSSLGLCAMREEYRRATRQMGTIGQACSLLLSSQLLCSAVSSGTAPRGHCEASQHVRVYHSCAGTSVLSHHLHLEAKAMYNGQQMHEVKRW